MKVFDVKNNYEVCGDVTVIFLNRRDGTILEALIDTVDFEIADSFPGKWYAHFDKDCGSFYVQGNIINPNGKKSTIFLHRLLCGNPPGRVIDHFNHNTLDNRRSVNLREVTESQNQQNYNRPNRNNKCGVLGVYKHRSKWRAMITLNGRSKGIGFYDTLDEAEKAVRKARAKLLPFSQEAFQYN